MDTEQKTRPTAAPPVSFDERRLVARLQAGEDAAFADLVRAYRRPVYGYMVRCGLQAAVCDDLFQQVFISVARGIPAFRAERPLKPWLFTIVANAVRSHFRRERVRELVYASADREDPAPGGQDLVEAQETAEWLAHAIGRLPFDQREVLGLVCVEGMALRDAARILEIPENTVKTRLRRARMMLAERLAQRSARQGREVSDE